MDLNFKTFGDGYPLIILHGLFGSLENWQTLSRAFASCYRVLTVDQRNHGHSPHCRTMDYLTMAEDLREFMQAQHISSPTYSATRWEARRTLQPVPALTGFSVPISARLVAYRKPTAI